MTLPTLDAYQRAQHTLDAVLAGVPADRWDTPSMCEGWTVRDVAGHVIWGQEQTRCWATGDEYGEMRGAPGAAHPRELAGDNPFTTWRAARAATLEVLTSDALGRTVTLPALGEIPLTGVLTLLVTDQLAHAWDIARPLDVDLRIDPELLPGSFAWARDNAVRAPGFFGPELTPPPDADELTRWLAFLGRKDS